jgi:hypothetical protein
MKKKSKKIFFKVGDLRKFKSLRYSLDRYIMS